MCVRVCFFVVLKTREGGSCLRVCLEFSRESSLDVDVKLTRVGTLCDALREALITSHCRVFTSGK